MSDLTPWIPAVGIVIVALAYSISLLNKVFRKSVSADTWNRAIAELCQQLGLQHHKNPAFFDMAMGNVGGRDLTVSIDVDAEGVGITHMTKVEMMLDAGWELQLKPRGADALFFESHAGAPTPVGDAAFDQAVDLRGASNDLLQALRNQPELRRLAQQVVGAGATVAAGNINLKCRSIPTTGAALRALVEPIVELARRIDNPTATHHQPATGTAATAQLNHIANLPAAERLPQFQAFLGQVGARLGEGQSYANVNQNEAEWRGSRHGVPLRIKVDAFPDVEVAAKVASPHGSIEINWDPTKAEQHTAPDAWDDSDVVELFIGKGVYLTHTQSELELQAARLRSLPADLTQAVARMMPAEHVRYLRIFGDTVVAGFGPSLNEMLDPEGQLQRVAEMVVWIARTLASHPPDPALAHATTYGWHAAQVAPVHRMKCAYCQTLYMLHGDHYACPNCGAPAQ